MPEQLVGLEIQGLRELQRALKRADRDLLTGVRRQLKGVAAITATEARALAGARTTRGTGDLIRGIKPFITAGGAGVRSGATHRGFGYPQRLEFEEGSRFASLYPAYRHTLPAVIAAGERAMAEIERDLAR
jgi:hypothetical protein